MGRKMAFKAFVGGDLEGRNPENSQRRKKVFSGSGGANEGSTGPRGRLYSFGCRSEG